MKNFSLIMAIICVFLLGEKLIDLDFSNTFSWGKVFDLLLPIALLYIFADRYIKEKNKEKKYG